MKRRDLEKKLKKLGWELKRNGANHDVWTNGKITEEIPRHRSPGRKALRSGDTGGVMAADYVD